jgi:regulator of nucleoside diphosphate kinase
MTKKSIHITEFDLARLEKLLSIERTSGRGGERVSGLEAEIRRATIVKAKVLPHNVVTMNSTVELADLDTGSTEVCTLVFPKEADIDRNKVSVLAPIGTAMLGYKAGDVFECQAPAGKRRLRVDRLLYQPETTGDHKL